MPRVVGKGRRPKAEGQKLKAKSPKPKAKSPELRVQSRGKGSAGKRLVSVKSKRARATKVLSVMEQLYPQAATELAHTNPFELLVATVLSAQATDASVNKATPALFKRFPDAFALAQAHPEEVEPYIKTIGLYRSKAKNLVMLARKLVEEHGAEVPMDKAQLRELPGVGWKTATVVLGAAFGVPGIAVDTHLTRLARRLGLSEQKDPEKIGADLERLFPEEKWVFVHHALILFGRYRCTARKPQCEGCPLWAECLSKGAW
ncbi:MAG: endonuclease III [Meiothermus sp.]|nr:MAG: endonuclease III [Meiothermus sp.]